jgi:hypothetical protein
LGKPVPEQKFSDAELHAAGHKSWVQYVITVTMMNGS